MLGNPADSLALSGESSATMILVATVVTPAFASPRPRYNGRSVLIATTTPIAVILKPISSATGAKVTLANKSAGSLVGGFPTGTPAELKEMERIRIRSRRNDEISGMTTSQLGVVVGLAFRVSATKLLINPPRSLIAAQKQSTKISMNATTSAKPFAGKILGIMSRNASRGRNPLRLTRLSPNCVAMIARDAIRKDSP